MEQERRFRTPWKFFRVERTDVCRVIGGARLARKAGRARGGNVECEMMNVELSELELAATEDGKIEG